MTITVRGGKGSQGLGQTRYGPWTDTRHNHRIIGQAIRDEVAALDVTYGAKLGIPRQTSIDYIAMAVDEISYGISGFKALKPLSQRGADRHFRPGGFKTHGGPGRSLTSTI